MKTLRPRENVLGKTLGESLVKQPLSMGYDSSVSQQPSLVGESSRRNIVRQMFHSNDCYQDTIYGLSLYDNYADTHELHFMILRMKRMKMSVTLSRDNKAYISQPRNFREVRHFDSSEAQPSVCISLSVGALEICTMFDYTCTF